MIKIGIIGGSGLEDPQILNNVREEEVATPYGKPTSVLKHGVINEKEVILISRHGKHHQYSPTEVNYRANLYALKEAGVTHILATTACGSLKEEIGRRHFVVLDQFIDFTKHRINTYADTFESGIVHVPMAAPFDETALSKEKILVMGGHREGIISFGKDLEEAGSILIDKL